MDGEGSGPEVGGAGAPQGQRQPREGGEGPEGCPRRCRVPVIRGGVYRPGEIFLYKCINNIF